MAATLRLEVWDAHQCDGGTRLAVLPLSATKSAVLLERTSFEDSLRLVVPKGADGAGYITLGAVIRRLADDGTFDEWRVHELNDQTGADGGRLEVTCRGMLYELRDAAVLLTTTGTAVTFGRRFDGRDGTSVINELLAELPGWWSLGTVEPTVVVSFELAEASVLAALQALVTACGAAGEPCEIEIARVGTSGYSIGLVTAVGSGAEVVDVRTQKNLLTSARSRSRETMVNRVYPTIGGAPSLPYAYARVASISGTDIEIRQPETGAALVGYDDQLNGAYLENEAGGFTLISASVAATSTVTVASAANLSVDGWCRVVADSSGTDFVSLAVPGASPVKVAPWDVGGDTVVNLVNNPFQSRWPGSASAAPPGWQVDAGTIARNSNTAFIRRGLYSALMSGSTSWALRTIVQKVLPGKGTTYSAKLTMYVNSGTPAVRLYNQSATILAQVIPASPSGWTEVEFTGVAIGAATGLYLRADAGSGTVYIDSAQITFGAVQSTWTQGSNASLGWTRANMLLAENATDPTTYTVTVADLNRWAAAEWPYDALVRGGTLSITDTELGLTYTARIREISRDLRTPAKTTLVLERLVRTFTRVLVNR